MKIRNNQGDDAMRDSREIFMEGKYVCTKEKLKKRLDSSLNSLKECWPKFMKKIRIISRKFGN
ncbi:hypothetical protein RchiOBHm_Chr0c18g0499971 [Rosa chinensis]|uniref:Uncharacterized protein n=1 Tax=Rosa chinensis TaxID=74649 RepID=A0A2P6SQM0_ROSCH|nr:hypothetical protein RchiOBHm_Chr0c18g0499971 [Rosa chinensis]